MCIILRKRNGVLYFSFCSPCREPTSETAHTTKGLKFMSSRVSRNNQALLPSQYTHTAFTFVCSTSFITPSIPGCVRVTLYTGRRCGVYVILLKRLPSTQYKLSSRLPLLLLAVIFFRNTPFRLFQQRNITPMRGGFEGVCVC